MKTRSGKFLYIITTILLINVCYGQKSSGPVKAIITADSMISGNSKDILTSFYQLAINNLTGPNKELNFNSNPFAIMLKSNPNLAIDSNYLRYKALRKLNFGFGIKLDPNLHFNGFSSGVKYALLDYRDTTTSKLLFENLQNDSLGTEADELQIELVEYAQKKYPNDRKKLKEFMELVHVFFNDNVPFNKLDSAFKKIVKESAQENHLVHILKIVDSNSGSNMITAEHHVFDSLKIPIKNSLLWTIGISDTTYKDQFFFSNILASTELSKGLGKTKPGSNWEFDVKASANLLNDTTVANRNLKRSIFSFEPGFNYVIRNKSNDQSFLELKFSGCYNHTFSGLYKNEKQDSLTINGTIRVRIINDIWIPLEFKYDPRSGNIFGFLNIRLNFTGQGKK